MLKSKVRTGVSRGVEKLGKRVRTAGETARKGNDKKRKKSLKREEEKQ